MLQVIGTPISTTLSIRPATGLLASSRSLSEVNGFPCSSSPNIENCEAPWVSLGPMSGFCQPIFTKGFRDALRCCSSSARSFSVLRASSRAFSNSEWTLSSSSKQLKMRRAPIEKPTNEMGREPWGRVRRVSASNLPARSARSHAMVQVGSSASNALTTYNGHVSAAATAAILVYAARSRTAPWVLLNTTSINASASLVSIALSHLSV
mmetsp:Transcript_73147/g.208429  ORF Transcript_73147/g.208429 Transcript_73147/m.208429 type:complete len:208 (+) Transcript_73147:756-1379(+)